jgi:hypothetical protein
MSIEGARNLTFVTGGPSEETIQFYMSGSQAWPIALSPEVVLDVLGKNTIVRPGIQLVAGDGESSDNASSITIILQIQDGDGVGAFSCYSENGFLVHVWETSSPT